MSEGFFSNLPFEITVDILSRLPIRTIVSCKCVCKLWLKLLDSHEFAKSHLSKSAPGLAYAVQRIVKPAAPYDFFEFEDILQLDHGSTTDYINCSYEFFEFEDILDLEHHDLHYRSVTKFVFPHFNSVRIQGSANGLLFLIGERDLYICNPITRHYITLYLSQYSVITDSKRVNYVTYGFGIAKVTGQHKVVRIVYDYDDLERRDYQRVTYLYCEVYTLGTRTWRSITSVTLPAFDYSVVFLNGNLHWLVVDPNAPPSQIYCFDLETELFSTFSHPPLQASGAFVGDLSAFAGCLCLSDNSPEDKVVIWLMREYGMEASWTNEYVISKYPVIFGDDMLQQQVYPIKVFKDGDILMKSQYFTIVFYSDKTKTVQKIDMFEELKGGYRCFNDAILYTPSFLSLKCFEMDDLRSF